VAGVLLDVGLDMRRHQLHVRITQAEYDFLAHIAEDTDESVATVVRRLIRIAMTTRRDRPLMKKDGTGAVPPLLLPS